MGASGRTGLFLDGQYLRPIASRAALAVGLTLSTQSSGSREMTIAPEVSILIPTLAHKTAWFTGVGAGYGVPVTGDGLHGGFLMIRRGVMIPIAGSLGGKAELRLAKFTGSQGTRGVASLCVVQYLDR